MIKPITNPKRQERLINKHLQGWICKFMIVKLIKNKTNDNYRELKRCTKDNEWCDGEKFHYNCHERRDCVD
jgi:hypothetical protein